MKQRLQIAVLATAVLLPLLAFSSAMVVLFDRQQKETVEHMLNHAAAALEDALDRELVSNIAGLESLATSIHLDDNDIVGFAVVARRLLESRGNWLSLRLLRAGDGTVLLTLPAGGGMDATTSPPSPEMVRDVVTARLPMVSEVRHDSQGEPFVSIVVPVLRNGTAVYALSAALRNRALSAALGGPTMPADWLGAALDTERVILARTRRQEEFVGKPVTESLRQRIDQDDRTFFFARTKEGEEVYSAFVTSASTGWTVVVAAPGETVAGPMRRSLMAVAGGGLLALVATVGLGALLVGNASRRHAMERRLLALEGERMAERRLADVAANLPGVIFRRVRDPDGAIRYPYLSAGLNSLAGEVPEAPPGADELEQLIHPEDRDGWREVFRPAEGGIRPQAPEAPPLQARHLEARIGPAAGPVRWVRVMARPVLTGENETAWDGVALDVTDLKETQHRLAASLAESQELLQEVHHRVKNNLQVVWSLIQLEAMQIEDREARDRMEIIGQRIGVMGRIHEQVYASKEFSRIDFDRQLRGLCDTLARTFGDSPGIKLEVSGDPLFCHLETAIPLGLIANELVANAFKHAFPGGSGTIRVSLRAEGDGAVLEISDDGVGMSGANTDRGLGLRLVKGLIRQIGATMRTGSGDAGTAGAADAGGGIGGTHVTISIPGPWYAR
ncbi:hypothetical protein JL100_000155 [Skermanella mucosa]|uniref:sensor histidine kinase n=1 Tax=Skermanella mucosa TaxID=1789672 RepID=UPI00192AF7FC|nr:sensor histidine kinase [Skermanella mucosa]UEM21248.1 hypothetical protein JL100_000155 [Skermanella mucosa]